MAERPEDLAREYEGGRFRVVHCDGAVESYWEALKHVDARKAKSFTRNMIAQIKRLADGQPMSKGSFPKQTSDLLYQSLYLQGLRQPCRPGYRESRQ